MLFLPKKPQAQSLSITKLVNDIYKDQAKAMKVDTIYFITNCDPDFFICDKSSQQKIKLVCLFSKDSIASFVKCGAEFFILRVRILSIGNKNLKLHIGIYKTSRTNENNSGDFSYFVDERTIRCILINNKWIFERILKIEDH
jgi:hypothetical protein